MWWNQDFEIRLLEEIEGRLGNLLTPNQIANNLFRKLQGKRNMDPREKEAWNAKIGIDNESYIKFISSFSNDPSAILAQISAETKSLHVTLLKLNAGISEEDTCLLANAQWIRSNGDYEPIIITDDSDLLTSAHALSSFFGISLGFLSSFEVLRLTEIKEPFPKCCKYLELSGNDNFAGLEYSWSQKELKTSIVNTLKKGKITYHPNNRIMNLK